MEHQRFNWCPSAKKLVKESCWGSVLSYKTNGACFFGKRILTRLKNVKWCVIIICSVVSNRNLKLRSSDQSSSVWLRLFCKMQLPTQNADGKLFEKRRRVKFREAMWTCHTRRSHSLWGLPGRRLVFERQISILCISLLEKDETEIVRYNPRITQTKVLPMWLFFFSFSGQRLSFTSTSLITHTVSTELICCTQKCKGLSISYLCVLFFRPASVYRLRRRYSPGRRSPWP